MHEETEVTLVSPLLCSGHLLRLSPISRALSLIQPLASLSEDDFPYSSTSTWANLVLWHPLWTSVSLSAVGLCSSAFLSPKAKSIDPKIICQLMASALSRNRLQVQTFPDSALGSPQNSNTSLNSCPFRAYCDTFISLVRFSKKAVKSTWMKGTGKHDA